LKGLVSNPSSHTTPHAEPAQSVSLDTEAFPAITKRV
jgi:hypothetical protein